MAIQVIERRNGHLESTYRIGCTKCKSTLEMNKSDMTITEERNETIYKFNCPVCKNDNYIDSTVMYKYKV